MWSFYEKTRKAERREFQLTANSIQLDIFHFDKQIKWFFFHSFCRLRNDFQFSFVWNSSGVVFDLWFSSEPLWKIEIEWQSTTLRDCLLLFWMSTKEWMNVEHSRCLDHQKWRAAVWAMNHEREKRASEWNKL